MMVAIFVFSTFSLIMSVFSLIWRISESISPKFLLNVSIEFDMTYLSLTPNNPPSFKVMLLVFV